MKRLYFPFICVLLVTFFVACKKTENASKFFSQIKTIDSYISHGENDKALSLLIALGYDVRDARQALSITKRMLSIGSKPEAIKFLQKTITNMPDSQELVALLISTLIDSGRDEGIEEYAPLVKNSSYASLVAESVAFKKHIPHFFSIDPYCWEAAYRLTGEQSFLQVSAMSFCKDGKIERAEFLREAIPRGELIKNPFFWSCISFDLGHFDFIFKHLDLSILNAEDAGVYEVKDVDVNKASRHLLLAADAAYGLGDIDIARAYWQTCADLNQSTPIALYNLALTSETEEEKAKMFVECIQKYPSYYPAISSYVRQYLALKDSEVPDEVTKYLAERGFYSMKAEDVYLSLPNLVYSPDKLLQSAMQLEDHDPRIDIEHFRYNHYKGIDFRSGIADMWKLLELYPDNVDVRTYAKWYFSHCRDFNACFSVGDTGNEALDAFYLGLEKAIRSFTDDDIIESFSKAATVQEYRVFATANIAYVYNQQKLKDKAIETLSLASSMTDNPKIKSRLHYQLALMLSSVKSYDRAISVLGYAIELDPENYPAQVLSEKLKLLK